jgi:hypothetical protein
MAVCPKPGCDSTEFKIEKIKVEGYARSCSLIVCKICGTAISLAPNEIVSRLVTLKSKS